MINCVAALSSTVVFRSWEYVSPDPYLFAFGMWGGLLGSLPTVVLALTTGQKTALKVSCASFSVCLITLYVFATAPADKYGGPGNDSAAVAHLRTISTAEATYRSSSGRYGNLDQLIEAGLIASRFTGGGAVSGYKFAITTDGETYTTTAEPANVRSGKYAYYSKTDAIVRYSTNRSLAPPNQAGQVVQ
jgi:hypothetical protein